MIKVEIYEHPLTDDIVFKVRGHAGSAPEGEDLVCAAVSAYVNQMAETVKALYKMGWLKGRPRIAREKGKSTIVFHPYDPFELKGDVDITVITKYMVMMSATGFDSLAKEVPQFVQFGNA